MSNILIFVSDVILFLTQGALDDVEAAFGMHVMPQIKTGVLATRAGTIMAGALSFHVRLDELIIQRLYICKINLLTLSYQISVHGRGGHAALPHLNIDPVVAAAAIITSFQVNYVLICILLHL